MLGVYMDCPVGALHRECALHLVITGTLQYHGCCDVSVLLGTQQALGTSFPQWSCPAQLA